MSDEKKTERFILSIEPSLLAAIDEWRAKQPGLPSRARAVRTLVTNGLFLDASKAEVEAALRVFASVLRASEADATAAEHLDRVINAKNQKDRRESWSAYRAMRNLNS